MGGTIVVKLFELIEIHNVGAVHRGATRSLLTGGIVSFSHKNTVV